MTAARQMIASLITVCLGAATASAGTLYVDNADGNDRYDGRAAVAVSSLSGPVRSIARALALVDRGDTVVIANHGIPYYESLSLVGSRVSGVPLQPFTIQGNGAIVDGSLEVPLRAWTRIGGNVWRMTPWRKGIAVLLNDGAPVPEMPSPSGRPLPALTEGHFCFWKGSIYFRPEDNIEPTDLPLSFAVQDVGLTLFNVHDVVVSNLTFRHFRIDGVNAHDQCRRVTLDRITSTENGRAGLTVAGSAAVRAVNCNFSGNRDESVRLDELGAVELKESKVDSPPAGAAPAR